MTLVPTKQQHKDRCKRWHYLVHFFQSAAGHLLSPADIIKINEISEWNQNLNYM